MGARGRIETYYSHEKYQKVSRYPVVHFWYILTGLFTLFYCEKYTTLLFSTGRRAEFHRTSRETVSNPRKGMRCNRSRDYKYIYCFSQYFWVSGTPVSYTSKTDISSFDCFDLTLAVAEALSPNKPNRSQKYSIVCNTLTYISLTRCHWFFEIYWLLDVAYLLLSTSVAYHLSTSLSACVRCVVCVNNIESITVNISELTGYLVTFFIIMNLILKKN